MMRRALLPLVLSFGAALMATSCDPAPDPDPDGDGWVLVWADEFDGPEGEGVDTTKWVHDVGGDGWGNNQLEFNTDRPDNANLDGNGFLRIVAQKEAFGGTDEREPNAWTSARLKTLDTFEFTYGRVEARIKLPPGQGMWPAFWMLGADFPDVGWPQCGEIDIMEARGGVPDTVLGTVHGPGYSGGGGVGDDLRLRDVNLQDDFYVYRIDWDPDHIVWSLKGPATDEAFRVFFTLDPGDVPGLWVFDHDFFLLLNLAVGGTFGPVDDTTPDRVVMGVDYVRVYQRVVPLVDPNAPVEE